MAGLESDGTVRAAAPIINYMIGWSDEQARSYIGIQRLDRHRRGTVRPVTLVRLAPGRPDVCRFCGDATWLADGDGGVHPCCAYWAVLEPDRPCVSCESSRAARRRNRRNDYHED